MCGIAGFFAPPLAEEQARLVAQAMGDRLLHRGPDAGAVWVDGSAGIGLAHRRLAIVDLSPAGAQPMASACGRMVICYNGEIYNSAALRQELADSGHCPAWRGHSDTETLVEACAYWGLEKTLPRLIGMFALALWDRQQGSVALARDRLGIKPLYWGRMQGAVLFGSELRALAAHPAWEGRLHRGAAESLLHFGAVQGDASIYQGVYHLPPGHWVRLDSPGSGADLPPSQAFWSLPEVFSNAATRAPLEDAAAIDALESLLQDAVSRRMMADVPLGAFLSGGIDSSLVAALMQRASDRPVQTFSIGFENADYDESHHAAAVAAHLATDHTELRVTAQDALDVVPRLATMFDEPFADSSQIPTFLVCQLTRQHVTVALSGDGGDELFAGYSRYTTGASLWNRLGQLPRPLRHMGAAVIDAVPPAAWSAACRVLPQRYRPFAPGDRFAKVARLLRADSLDSVHLTLAAQGAEAPLNGGGQACFQPVGDVSLAAGICGDGVRRMQGIDLLTYLPSDILTKVDRASMAVALEARVPLLDHRVVEFAAGLPLSQKIRHGQGKWVLRQVLYRHAPESLFNRPKQGFAAPIAEWLRGPLRPWAEDLIGGEEVSHGGLLNAEHLRLLWRQHQSGTRSHTGTLWAVLMLLAWMREARPRF